MLPSRMGGSGPAAAAVVRPEPVAAPGWAVPAPETAPAPAAAPPVTELVAFPAPPLTPPAPAVPGRGCATPFCGSAETALSGSCCCCWAAAPVDSGPPFTAVTMASCVRRLPPQALTAIAGRIASVHHRREPVRAAIGHLLHAGGLAIASRRPRPALSERVYPASIHAVYL